MFFSATKLHIFFPIQISVTCNDGIKNGDETGVDCGGSCSRCGRRIRSPLSNSIFIICGVILCKTINFISLKLLIAKGCQDQLPDDYGGTSHCTWACTDWAPTYCDDDWSQHSHCVDTPSGKIKDSCRKACGNCHG